MEALEEAGLTGGGGTLAAVGFGGLGGEAETFAETLLEAELFAPLEVVLLGEDLLEDGRDFLGVLDFPDTPDSPMLSLPSASDEAAVLCTAGVFLPVVWRNFAVRDFLEAAIVYKLGTQNV